MTRPFVAPDSPGAVLELIRSGRATSRSDIARLTGVSASTAALRVRALTAHGYLREVGPGPPQGGRRPRLLEARTDTGVIGVADLGSNHASLALLDLGGQVLTEFWADLYIGEGPKAVLDYVYERLSHEITKLGGAPLRGITIGVPGPVDARTGTVVSPSRMPGWHGTDVRTLMREVTDVPVLVENDANLMAVGELSASRAKHLVFLKAGTGIGCGVIASGRLHHGGVGAAGDISHLAVHGFAHVACSCGRNGCLDTVASGAALVRDLNTAGVKVRHTGDILELAGNAQPDVLRLLREAGRATGEVLATIVNFFNPEVLVIGGLLSRADAYVASIRSELYERCLPMATDNLSIVTTRTGKRAGMLGAGQLMLEYLFDPDRVNAVVEQKT